MRCDAMQCIVCMHIQLTGMYKRLRFKMLKPQSVSATVMTGSTITKNKSCIYKPQSRVVSNPLITLHLDTLVPCRSIQWKLHAISNPFPSYISRLKFSPASLGDEGNSPPISESSAKWRRAVTPAMPLIGGYTNKYQQYLPIGLDLIKQKNMWKLAHSENLKPKIV